MNDDMKRFDDQMYDFIGPKWETMRKTETYDRMLNDRSISVHSVKLPEAMK